MSTPERTLERILSLIERNNITAAQLLRETKLNSGSMAQWKKGIAKPSYGALVKIADYFRVSVDYLLGSTDDPSPVGGDAPYITPEEFAVVERLRNLPPEKRNAVEALLNQL